MKSLEEFENIFIHRGYVDMRKSFYTLSILVDAEMKLDLRSSSLFVFTNRRRNLIKALYFDGDGFSIWSKKLEEAKFPWPKDIDKEFMSIDVKEMKSLLSGINSRNCFKKIDFEYTF